MRQTKMSGAVRSNTKMKAPPHPFPELQGPFEESMAEIERYEEIEVPSDAASRRTILLDAPTYQRVIAGRWKQRPGERYHPLWKIVAQLSFGIHLLADNLAKSEEEVMQILQGHIDEIDLFLERTTEDFALAHEDVQERMRCLQLPLQHPKVFDRMLEDRTFRNSIVEGNEKIEHIVARTSCAMRDSLKDAQKGLDATHALQQYLASLEHSWGRRNAEHEIVFDAMLENVEGWREAFIDLHTQGESLSQLLKSLTEVINQMQQRAGEVSRRLIRSQQAGHSPTSSQNITYIPRHSTSTTEGSRAGTPDRPPRKPLPGVPDRDSGRTPSGLGQRCETSQSTRSGRSQRSSAVPRSGNSSRADTYVSARESLRHSGQPRLSAKSPRLIDIKRLSPQSREAFSTAPSTTELIQSSRSTSHPVELSAEPLRTSLQTAPRTSNTNPNAGLGILQDGGSTQTTEASAGPDTGLTPSSKLPLTPNSMKSDEEARQAVAHELPSEPVPTQVAPRSDVSQIATETSMGSPPSTPSWAKSTFEAGGKSRMVLSKSAFRSHPPTADLGSPPVNVANKFTAQPQHTRLNGSIASSIGAPGPELHGSNSTTSSPVKASSLSIKQSHNDMLSVPAATQKLFVAELEGTTPILLKPVTYTASASPVSQAREPRKETHDPVELEAPLETLKITTTGLSPSQTLSSSGSNQQLREGSDSLNSSGTIQITPHSGSQGANAGIRKSFIATNVELPAISIEPRTMQFTIPETHGLRAKSAETPTREISSGVEDILARLDELNANSPNLSLKGEETLLVLPAKTYVASRDMPSPVITRQRPDLPGRNSSESTASSQSQWRAFFRGQLSPADFNANTPQIPSKSSAALKAVVDLQRRGQDSSPTLGWQWAPETPEVETATHKK